MGNTCNGSSIQQYQVNQLPLNIQSNNRVLSKRNTVSDRFRQQVQKLKLQQQNMYKLILTVSSQREQNHSINMKFIFSYADMQITPQYQFTLQDINHFPIIDTFQSSIINNTEYLINNNPQYLINNNPQSSPINPNQYNNNNNPQIYHKIRTVNKRKKIMKYYNFRSLNDYQLKKGLYQISLYNRLQHKILQQYFIIYKGQMKQLVMIFSYCYVSLHDVLYYRQLANYEWSQLQILLIMNMLCQNLLQLKRVNIIHRDIRPSKVFFSPINIGDSQQSFVLKNNNQNSRFYNFVNLESSRIYQMEFNHNVVSNNDFMADDVDLLTIKGVPTFNDSPVRQSLQHQQHKSNYNPYKNDINSIKNTLISLINLQPNNITNHIIQQKIKNKKQIKQLIKFISLPNITLQQLNDKILLLMGITSIAKPLSYYVHMRDFYVKQLTICQNIQMNLYFNSNTLCVYYNDSNISTMNQSNNNNTSLSTTNNQQRLTTITGKQYIQTLYIKCLYDLHKKDTFIPYMLQKLSKNFQQNRRQQNINLLMKVGRYFEQSGIIENQYYKQAILLLLQLAQQQRIQGFYKDHHRYIVNAEEIFNKFQSQSKMILRAKCILLKQQAYKQLFTINNNKPIQQIINQPYNSTNSQFYPLIQRLINQSYQLAIRSNLPFQQQLQLIYSKAQLYLLMNRLEQSQTFYITGYQLSERNYKQFMTVHNCTKYKGMFEYGLALIDLLKLKYKLVDKTSKIIFTLNNKLNNVKQRYLSISINPVYVIKCYLSLGDLQLLKQSSIQGLNYYQKALNLLHATNSQKQQRIISAQIQLLIVQQIINIFNNQFINIPHNKYDIDKYQQLYQLLKKEINKQKKQQNKYSRKGKSTNKLNKSSAITNQPQKYNISTYSNNMEYGYGREEIANVLPIIRQQQQDNKMVESSLRRINVDNNNYDDLGKQQSNRYQHQHQSMGVSKHQYQQQQMGISNKEQQYNIEKSIVRPIRINSSPNQQHQNTNIF